jgi:hypothetical protein
MTSHTWVFLLSCSEKFFSPFQCTPDPCLPFRAQLGEGKVFTTIAELEMAGGEKPSSLPPVTSRHIPFWFKFLVLAAYEAQLSKELLVPFGALGDPIDNSST